MSAKRNVDRLAPSFAFPNAPLSPCQRLPLAPMDHPDELLIPVALSLLNARLPIPMELKWPLEYMFASAAPPTGVCGYVCARAHTAAVRQARRSCSLRHSLQEAPTPRLHSTPCDEGLALAAT